MHLARPHFGDVSEARTHFKLESLEPMWTFLKRWSSNWPRTRKIPKSSSALMHFKTSNKTEPTNPIPLQSHVKDKAQHPACSIEFHCSPPHLPRTRRAIPHTCATRNHRQTRPARHFSQELPNGTALANTWAVNEQARPHAKKNKEKGNEKTRNSEIRRSKLQARARSRPHSSL